MSGNIVLRAIEASGAGTQAGFGRLIGKAQSTVWKYVKQGDFPLHVIPDVERVTGIPRAELAPDFFAGGAAKGPSKRRKPKPTP